MDYPTMTRSSHRAIGAMSELGRTALGYFHRLALRINDHKISYEMSPTNPWLPKNQLKALIAMSAIYSLSHKYTGGRNVSYEARLWNTNVSRRKPRRAQDRTDIKHMAGEAARGGQYIYPHVNNGESTLNHRPLPMEGLCMFSDEVWREGLEVWMPRAEHQLPCRSIFTPTNDTHA